MSGEVVAMLRGINVGGHRKVPMAELRTIATDAGFDDVATYIQSGNVVLRSELAPDAVESTLEAAIEAAMGFDVAVVARSLAELDDLVAHGPYPEVDDPTKRIVTFFRDPLPPDLLDRIDLAACAPETATVRGRDLFLHLPNGQGRATLPDLIGKAFKGSVCTTRNWRTVATLHSMATELATG